MKGKKVNPNTGKEVSGAALQQLIIKQNGGWDLHHQNFAKSIADAAAKAVVAELLENFDLVSKKPRLKRVK